MADLNGTARLHATNSRWQVSVMRWAARRGEPGRVPPHGFPQKKEPHIAGAARLQLQTGGFLGAFLVGQRHLWRGAAGFANGYPSVPRGFGIQCRCSIRRG